MARRNKICVLTSCYPRSEDDWAGVFVQTLTEGLSKQFQISVVAPDDCEKTDDSKHIKRFGYAPKKHQRLAYGSGILENIGKNPASIALLPPFIISFLKTAWRESRNADIIHSHWLVPSGLIGALLHSLTKKTHILTVHSGGLHFLRRVKGGRALIRFILNRSSHIVAVSAYTREILLDSVREKERKAVTKKLSIIPMPVTLEEIKTTKETLKKRYRTKEKNIILYIGRLIKVKGLVHLLKAMEELNSKAILLIAGEGQDRDDLEKYAKEKKLPIRFLGAVGSKRKAELLKIADVFALPSIILPSGRQEGLPVSVLEAVSAGVPVVASDVGGISEIIQDGITGFIVPPANPAEISAKINQILGNKGLREVMSARCRQKGENFSAEHITETYSKIILNLLQS